MNLKNYLNYLVEWVKQSVLKANAKGVIIGISGGIDSALVARIGQLAFPENHLAVIMPCESDPIDEKYANELVFNNNINSIKVDLSSVFHYFKTSFENNQPSNLALANSKARLRMTTLYALAQTNNYLVLGTDNACEWHIGYFTKYGDGGCDLAPIIHLLKQDVETFARYLNVTSTIINRKPTAGLWSGQTDENELGFTYKILDDYLQGLPINQEDQNKINKMHEISQHKRESIKIPDQPYRVLTRLKK